MLVATVVAAMLASIVLLGLLIKSGLHGPLDSPNERSLHSLPVPRSGGIGILGAVAVGFLVADGPWAVAVCALALAAVSAIDDRSGLPAGVRLAVQLGVVGTYVLVVRGEPAGLAASLALVLALVWMTNLYNFMDGADGLAGGMSLFGFGGYALAAFQAGEPQLGLICACVAAGAAGFLLYNFHPARIFMGDVGSIPLGFLAGAIGLEGVQREAWPAWFPVLVFSPFICDASLTLLRRLLRGERVWQAHREHYYQRMILSGLGHRGTALIWYGLMAASAGIACALRTGAWSVVATSLAAFAVGYAVLAVAVDVRCRPNRRNFL